MRKTTQWIAGTPNLKNIIAKDVHTHTKKKGVYMFSELALYLHLRSVVSGICTFIFVTHGPAMGGECKGTGNRLDPSKHHLWHWHHA